MPEIAAYVNRGTQSITPAVVEKVVRKLPLWKAEFAGIDAPKYPHLAAQLEFLADAVEDSVDGAYKDLPYCAFSAGVFALLYAHKQMDLIPDTRGDLGWADDSSVVRAVLIQHEKAFSRYAEHRNRGLSKQSH
jgi:uncharacterized membrane protein YkvA (DUF1232 family)